MNMRPRDRLPAAMLAACMTGLAICPFLFIAIGALSNFSPSFSFFILPPFLLGSGFLLWRFFSKPADQAANFIFLAMEAISWIGIVASLFLISGFTLMTGFERLGLACTFFLLASAVCLPVIWVRRTTLEERLAHLSKGVAISILLLILMLSGLSTAAYILSKPAFI